MHSLCTATLALSVLATPLIGQSLTPCKSVGQTKKEALIEYVRKKYKLPDSITLSLFSDELMAGTCFHQLTFEGAGALKKWRLKLYLSPDERYLTSDLFDTALDPIEEERSKLQTLMVGLSENKGASRGPDHAPVTIVEFSDFQCPYCRRFSEIMQEVLPGDADKVREVFHHMPLSMHTWARAAAEGAACAQFQSSEAFWAMHDQLFMHQAEITAGNLKAKFTQIARTIPDLNLSEFQSCLDNEMSLGLVIRDINLATSNEVTGTPTLFINGHRVQGVKDAAQLRELISEALKAQQSRKADESP